MTENCSGLLAEKVSQNYSKFVLICTLFAQPVPTIVPIQYNTPDSTF